MADYRIVTIQEPLARFSSVYAAACSTGMDNPHAMVLATVDSTGRPWSRVVLLKEYDKRGFVFYTNLESRKGLQIRANERVSLNFFWRELGRQVIILGDAAQIRDDEADRYFATRPRLAQLGAWASKQSELLKSQTQLLAAVAKLETKYVTRCVPRPTHWSGYRVRPHDFEFWVAGKFRLHHREVFEKSDEDGWKAYGL